MADITIGMPVFNDLDFIEESLACILNQTFRDFVLIISDDASTDGSGEICRKYAEKDTRIKYIKHEINIGISRNMQFLLSIAETEFFMWAGDDDLYDPNFIKYHIDSLIKNQEAVSAFGSCVLIDETGKKISEPISFNYANPDRTKRLKNYIKNSADYFGYGVFRREKIRDVKFPVWWWPNKKTPYNNIYPTLCFYLAKGDFVLVDGLPLFFKRIKPENKTNHRLIGKNHAVKESLAFWIRKLNLVWFSFKMIGNAGGFFLAFRLLSQLFYYWFIVPSWQQFCLAAGSFLKNRLMCKKPLL